MFSCYPKNNEIWTVLTLNSLEFLATLNCKMHQKSDQVSEKVSNNGTKREYNRDGNNTPLMKI